MYLYWAFDLCKDSETSIDRYLIPIWFIHLLEISTQLGEAVVELYLSEGLKCPSVLRKGLFTTAAFDNIDHSPNSTTSKSSFHGTGIFIFQHLSGNYSGTERNRLTLGDATTSKQVPSLPDSYINVKPAFMKSKPLSPKSAEMIQKLQDHDYLGENLLNEYEWLNEARLIVEDANLETISWSAFHLSKQRCNSVEISLTSLLPLFQEQAHSVAMIKHSMDKVKYLVNFKSRTNTDYHCRSTALCLSQTNSVGMARNVRRRQVYCIIWWLVYRNGML